MEQPQDTFYVELHPVNTHFTTEALQISKLSLERLAESGLPPFEAMAHFADWVKQVAGSREPVFVAFNAPFDWMFVNDYFHRYLGRNPFGHSALDIKAFYMGLTGASWQATGLKEIARYCGLDLELSHNALQDALDQAELFRCLLQQARQGAGLD